MQKNTGLKIYFCGNVAGSYRAQNMLKAAGDAGIPFSYVAHAAFRPEFTDNRYLRFALVSLARLVLLPARFVLVVVATHLVVLPLNSSYTVLFELLVGRLFGKKIVVDYYISTYDTTVNDRKSLEPESFHARLHRWRDRFLIKFADKLIFLNRSESEYYLAVAQMTVDEGLICDIPLCVDYKKETFSSRIFNPSLKPEAPAAKFFRVCWWGTYIPLHGLDNLINAIALTENDRIILHIFGNSDVDAHDYRELAERLGLMGRVLFDNKSSFVNGKLGPWLAENCDLAIGNFGSSEKARTVLVNKIVDAMAMGIPCLTMKTKATVELLDAYECLFYCESSPHDIAVSLDTLSTSLDQSYAKVERGFKAYLELFSPDVFREKFLAALYAV